LSGLGEGALSEGLGEGALSVGVLPEEGEGGEADLAFPFSIFVLGVVALLPEGEGGEGDLEDGGRGFVGGTLKVSGVEGSFGEQ